MPTYEVECVDADDSSEYDDCRCVNQIGIRSESGGVNTYTPEEIHDRIVEKDHKFYVEHEGEETFLKPAEREGTKYVRTEPNDTAGDNLLKQDSCPV